MWPTRWPEWWPTKKILADMEFDMVAYKDLAKLADMVAGHGGWLIGLKLF